MLGAVGETIGLLRRTLQALRVAARHLVGIGWERLRRGEVTSGPTRLHDGLSELGGAFIKFGQLLSVQVDMLPEAYCDALLDLLGRVPPFDAAEARRIVAEELGAGVESRFREFDDRTLGSASIGQVHRAELTDGTVVAVKVQRPGIRAVFRRDTLLLVTMVRIVSLLRIRSLYFLRNVIREWESWVEDEIDYRREAANADALARAGGAGGTAELPRIHWELTTVRVMTMDFLEGMTVAELLRRRADGESATPGELEAIGFEPEAFAANIARNYLDDAFRSGVFHADLHPANLIVRPDNVVGYVDFGIVGRLNRGVRRQVLRMTEAWVTGNTDLLYTTLLDLSTLLPDADLDGLRADLAECSRSWYEPLTVGGEVKLRRNINAVNRDLLRICRRRGLLLNRELVKYIRAVTMADGLIGRVAPRYDYFPLVREVTEEELLRDAQATTATPDAMLTATAEALGWLRAGPGVVARSFERLERRLQGPAGEPASPPDGPRAFRWALLVWAVLATALALHFPDSPEAWRSLPVVVTAGLLIGWSGWLLSCWLRRD